MIDLLERSPFDPAKERRVVIIADWLPPDFGAVGQYMQMRAETLAARGHDVTLIGLSLTAGSTKTRPVGDGSLTEIRLKAKEVPRRSLVHRLLWTVWTNLRLVAAGFRRLRIADGILFTGSPPFLIHLLAPLRPALKGRLVYRITDFHPECLIAAQERPSRLLNLLLAVTNFWRHRIDGFEVLGLDQLRRLRATGIPEHRIALVRDGSPVSFDGDPEPEPRPKELEGSCVLLYSGNYGVAHEVGTVAAGYRLHHHQGTGRVRLWLSATGAGASDLARALAADQLPYHRSSPVPLARLAGLLRSPDAHLVTLKDGFVGFVMPSKVYACVASARPILFVGSAESDVDMLARQSVAGYWRVSCGDPQGFADALERLADEASKSLQSDANRLP